MKKKNDNQDNSPEFSRDREFAVVLEGLRSDFRVFGEELVSVKEDLTIVKKDLSALKKDFAGLRVNQARTLERVTSIELTQRQILGALEDHNIRLS